MFSSGLPGMGNGSAEDTTRLYHVLQLGKGASQQDISKAYKKLALKFHPDKGGDPQKFNEITRAYEILSQGGKGNGKGGAKHDDANFTDLAERFKGQRDHGIFSARQSAPEDFVFMHVEEQQEVQQEVPRPRQAEGPPEQIPEANLTRQTSANKSCCRKWWWLPVCLLVLVACGGLGAFFLLANNHKSTTTTTTTTTIVTTATATTATTGTATTGTATATTVTTGTVTTTSATTGTATATTTIAATTTTGSATATTTATIATTAKATSTTTTMYTTTATTHAPTATMSSSVAIMSTTVPAIVI